MSTNKQESTNERDGLALIIGGLFIVALVFAAYNYFNKSSEEFNRAQNEYAFEDEELGTGGEEMEGDLNGNAASDSKVLKSSNITDENIVKAKWVANNYNEGDIQGTSYTVVSGDTLWEIAEGAYGDGSQWTKILEANKANVGFLVNGQQALIVSGQVLVLP